MTLSRKLILAFMALAGAALVSALLLTTFTVREAAEEKIASDLARTLEGFKQRAWASQEHIRDVAEARTLDRSFKEMSLSVNSADAEAGLGDANSETEGINYARDIIDSADTEAFGWSRGAPPPWSFFNASGHLDSAATEAFSWSRRGPVPWAFFNASGRLDSADTEAFGGSRGGPVPWAFFNASGRLVYTRADPSRVGDGPLSFPLLDTALRGGPTSALWSPAQLRALPFAFVPPWQFREGDLLLVHAQPAYGSRRDGSQEASPVGVVLSGQWVGDVLLKDPTATRAPIPQVADTSARFAVRAGDGALVSQVPVGTRFESDGWQPGQANDLYLGDTRYFVREGVLLGVDGTTSIGQVFVLRDFDAEINPILQLVRRGLIRTAVGVALFALVAAIYMARSMAAPLVQLEAAADRVRLGDLSVEVPVRGTDEVGRVAQSFNEMVGGLRQRDQIKGLFKRYLSPQVVDELIKHPEKAAPGGERKMLTVLFSDLVGFTSMSEQMSPEELVALLNTYFEQATGVLTQHGATLDKFIGDAIMCFWNAPLPQEDHAARACLTALDLVAVVERLAPMFEARGLPRLDCRIGINTGQAIAGNIGSSVAQDYTVIGDTVNLASRLEGAARFYGTRTLVAEDTLTAARDVVLARELDLVRVKGKQQPVRVFELVGPAGTPPPPHLARFAEGLALYRERDFAAARLAFLASPEDKASARFVERCGSMLLSPPPEDWDGVHVLDSK